MANFAEILATFEHGTGASEAAIEAAERAIGSRFPPEYRAFVAAVGWANIEHMEVLGIGGAFSVVDNYLSEHDLDASFPRSWIPFYPDGGGNSHCVDADSGEVRLWMHDDPATRDLIATGFADWLRMAVEDVARSPGEAADSAVGALPREPKESNT